MYNVGSLESQSQSQCSICHSTGRSRHEVALAEAMGVAVAPLSSLSALSQLSLSSLSSLSGFAVSLSLLAPGSGGPGVSSVLWWPWASGHSPLPGSPGGFGRRSSAGASLSTRGLLRLNTGALRDARGARQAGLRQAGRRPGRRQGRGGPAGVAAAPADGGDGCQAIGPWRRRGSGPGASTASCAEARPGAPGAGGARR